jgi:hypothetical protein
VSEERPSPPPVPSICDTALGQASTKFVKQAVLSNINNMERSDILELRKELNDALTQSDTIVGIDGLPVESDGVSVGSINENN